MNITQAIIDSINGEVHTDTADVVSKCLQANPYAHDTFNLTLQLEASVRVPDLARTLKERAITGIGFEDYERSAWMSIAQAKDRNSQAIIGRS